MKSRKLLCRASVLLALLPVLAVLTIKIAYAQTGEPEPPGISQIVEGLMSIGGTWAVAWVANKIRIALGGSADVFLAIIVPLIGLGVSWLVGQLGEPGNSWLISFLMTLAATWFDQLRVKLLERLKTA